MWPAGLERSAADILAPEALTAAHRELLKSALSGRDALGILPTDPVRWLLGALASLWLPGKVLIVTPLSSLASERAAAFSARDAAARAACSAAAEVSGGALAGRDSRAVYLAPSALNAEVLAGASLTVIEHAHCVSPWGHELRPEYLSLARWLTTSGRSPVLALTGAATRAAEHDIVRRLSLRQPCVARTAAVRQNVHISVAKVRSADKLPRVLELVRAQPGPGAIVASSVDVAMRAWTELVRSDVAAALYHAELDAAARAAARNALAAGRARVVVTVGAQALLLDHLDARFVVHWDVPESLEGYADPLGCAGRDGAPVSAVLLYQRTDASLHRMLANRRYPTRQEVEHALTGLAARGAAPFQPGALGQHMAEEKALVFCHELERLGVLTREDGSWRLSTRDAGAAAASTRRFDELRAHDERRIEQMLGFAEQERCRSAALRSYFGESAPERCGTCDVCTRPRARR